MVATKHMTADELLALPRDEARIEVIEGEPTEMSPAGGQHMLISSVLNNALVLHCSADATKLVAGGDAGIVISTNPDTVLSPDLSVFDRVTFIKAVNATGGFARAIPLIAVEIKSPSDREPVIAKKLSIYLQAGVRQVWWVRPENTTLTVHTPDSAPVVLSSDDTLGGGDELPGFTLQLSTLFIV